MPEFVPRGWHDEYDLCKGVHVTERRDSTYRLILRLESARKITSAQIKKILKGPHTEIHALHEIASGGDRKSGFWIELEEIYEGEVEWPNSAPHGQEYWDMLSMKISQDEYKEIRRKKVAEWEAANPPKPLTIKKYKF